MLLICFDFLFFDIYYSLIRSIGAFLGYRNIIFASFYC